MPRIYTNQSIFGAGANGYLEGQKLAEDENYRQEELAAKKAQLLQQAAKDILGTQYSEKPHDKRGNFTGYEVTPEVRDKSNNYLKNIVPQFYEKPGNPGTPEVFSTESDRLRAKALGDMSPAPVQPQQPPVQAPPQVQPLLKSKDSAKAENDMAMAKDQQAHEATIAEGNKPVSLGKEQYQGTQNGVDKFKQPVNTEVSFGDAVIAPENPPTKEEFTPPDFMLGDIAKAATSAQAKDTDPLISMSTLPPEVKQLMGIAPEFQGSLRSSIVKELLQAGSKKLGPAQTPGVRPEVQAEIDDVLSGKTTPAAVARKFPDLTKTEYGYLNRAAISAIGQEKSNKAFDYKKGQDNRLSPNELIKVQDGHQAFKVADDLEATLNANKDLFGPTKGLVGKYNPYDERSQSVNSMLYEAKQMIGKFLEGGVLRKEDESKYERMLPQLSDQPKVALAKLQGIRKMLSDKARGYQSVLGKAGYDVSPFEELVKMGPPDAVTRGGGNSAPSGAAGGVDRMGKAILGDKSPKSDGGAYNADLRKAKVLLGEYRGIIQRRMLSEKKSAGWASDEIDKKKKELNQYFRNTHGQDFQE